jgi:acetyl esterase/lipase
MKFLSRPSGVDVERSRRDMLKNARTFSRKGRWLITPVKIGGLDAEWIEAPQVDSGRVVLYFHGGSFISGSPQTHRSMVGTFAETFSGRCLSLDYRLAPEHPFPAAVEDCLAAYKWLLAQTIPVNRIFVAGDSAGGTLSLALLLSIREAGLPMPAAAVLFSPAADLTFSGMKDPSLAKKDLLLNIEIIRQEISLYLNGADPQNPLVSPLFGDLHGLPPVMIQVGDSEILLPDATRLAEKLQGAGVEVVLDVEPGGQHVYQFAAAIIPEARQALQRAGQFIQKW